MNQVQFVIKSRMVNLIRICEWKIYTYVSIGYTTSSVEERCQGNFCNMLCALMHIGKAVI